MGIEFDKYAQEGKAFINELSRELGHEDKNQVGIVLRAVLHTLRDRITISESFDLLAQLPMFLKALYVDNWKYRPKPLEYTTLKEFTDKVEEEQARYGERRFDWKESTTEITTKVLACLGKYISGGESQDIRDQLPKEIKEIMQGLVKA